MAIPPSFTIEDRTFPQSDFIEAAKSWENQAAALQKFYPEDDLLACGKVCASIQDLFAKWKEKDPLRAKFASMGKAALLR